MWKFSFERNKIWQRWISRHGEYEQPDEAGQENAGADAEDAAGAGGKDGGNHVGGGMVTVVANGKKEILEIDIKPEVVDPDDIEMLQDLIIAAVNEAVRKADEMVQGEMARLTGGMGIPPGLF